MFFHWNAFFLPLDKFFNKTEKKTKLEQKTLPKSGKLEQKTLPKSGDAFIFPFSGQKGNSKK